MQKYIIIKDLDDHLEYVIGSIVTKTGDTIDGLMVVTDGTNEWLVSEDEIELV